MDERDQKRDGVVEKFTPGDLLLLRHELLQSGVDSFQAAEIVANFLTGRGYGVGSQEARGAAAVIEAAGATPERIQQELERVARVM
ncbi:MAG: hypothetical protein PW735_04035 [Acidobacteriaceae bacterium]|nr:hypothetical protein [Acidobacteriaceae bacterium]